MQNNPPLTFGPVNSRRFGISLGIDLSPFTKQCNFDCLYCELQGSKTVNNQNNIVEVDKYIQAVKDRLIQDNSIEVITLTANGEPTLYPYLEKLVDELNQIKQHRKLLILTNSSLIYKESVFRTLQKIDIVKLSLDCATKKCFTKLDRLDKSLNYQDIIDGIITFSKVFNNDLVIEVLFVDGINNNDDEINKIYDILKLINPTRIDIGTIDRPPAYDVKPIGYEDLRSISDKFSGLNISIAHKKQVQLNKSMNETDILNLLDKRPQTKEDITNLLDIKSKVLFDNLVENDKIIIRNQAGVEFYVKGR